MSITIRDGVLSFMEEEKRPIKAIVLGTNVNVCTKKSLTLEQAQALIMERWANPKKGKNEKNYYYCKEHDSFHTTSL